ncbi:MAG: formyltransferase family protein [Bacteroidetes bacterium]|nr:formyltransferase family protein [Bacteroidota bacterium]
MTNPDNEKLVHYLVVLDKQGRQFITEDDTRWGGLIEPSPSENADKSRNGLRIVLFGSWEFGYLVLETLKEYERRFPEKLNLVGLVTDNPLNPDAKISLKKRVWNFIDLPFRVFNETFTIESGLSHGIPVYTGEVKVKSFQNIMEKWKPDAILVCVFGQIIDSFTINLPRYGIYNFHPSDLTLNQGAGPAPYEDLTARNAETAVWSVHHVTEEIDHGHVIGQSPPVNVRNKEGILPGNPLVVYQKLGEALTPLTFFLIEELSRRFEMNKPGPIDVIDFTGLIPDKVKQSLMQPIISDLPSEILPKPDTSIFISIQVK